MVQWINHHPTLTIFIAYAVLMIPVLFFGVRGERRAEERDRIKQRAEEEYEKWKKERGLG